MRLVIAVLLLAAAPLRAQTDTTRVPADSVRAAVALTAVCPGATVRIYSAPGGPVQGRCGAVMDGRLVVRHDGGELAVPVAGVREAWVRERTTERGIWMGATTGAVTLVGLGLLVTSALCYSSDCSRDYMLAIGFGTVVGGGTGALLGGTIGYLTKRWVRRYP